MSADSPGRGAALVEIPLSDLPLGVRRHLEGVDRLLVYHLPLVTRFRRVTSREGLLLHGPAGWSECAPFWDYDARESAMWLAGALADAAMQGPAPLRRRVPVNVTIPVSSPEAAAERVRASGGCATAKVKVADPGVPLAQDAARVEAVADALRATVGERARVRVDVNAAWDRDEALAAIRVLDRAAAVVGGLEYVEQPCASVEDLAAVRRRVDVPIAADESIRRASDPLAVARAGAADVAVVKVAPLGGVARALEIGEATGLSLVLSSALETSLGLAVDVRAAACLERLDHACGLATAQLLAADVVPDPLLPVDGTLEVHRLEVDERLVGRHLPPEGTVERWLSRLGAMCAALDEEGR